MLLNIFLESSKIWDSKRNAFILIIKRIVTNMKILDFFTPFKIGVVIIIGVIIYLFYQFPCTFFALGAAVRDWASLLIIGVLMVAVYTLWINIGHKVSKPEIDVKISVNKVNNNPVNDHDRDSENRPIIQFRPITQLDPDNKKTNVELKITFENKGINLLYKAINRCTFCSENSSAQDLQIQVHFPLGIDIISSKRQNWERIYAEKKEKCFDKIFDCAESNLIKEPTRYIFVPDPFQRTPPIISSLRHDETEYCTVCVEIPNKSHIHKIYFDMSSRDIGVFKFQTKEIVVKTDLRCL